MKRSSKKTIYEEIRTPSLTLNNDFFSFGQAVENQISFKDKDFMRYQAQENQSPEKKQIKRMVTNILGSQGQPPSHHYSSNNFVLSQNKPLFSSQQDLGEETVKTQVEIIGKMHKRLQRFALIISYLIILLSCICVTGENQVGFLEDSRQEAALTALGCFTYFTGLNLQFFRDKRLKSLKKVVKPDKVMVIILKSICCIYEKVKSIAWSRIFRSKKQEPTKSNESHFKTYLVPPPSPNLPMKDKMPLNERLPSPKVTSLCKDSVSMDVEDQKQDQSLQENRMSGTSLSIRATNSQIDCQSVLTSFDDTQKTNMHNSTHTQGNFLNKPFLEVQQTLRKQQVFNTGGESHEQKSKQNALSYAKVKTQTQESYVYHKQRTSQIPQESSRITISKLSHQDSIKSQFNHQDSHKNEALGPLINMPSFGKRISLGEISYEKIGEKIYDDYGKNARLLLRETESSIYLNNELSQNRELKQNQKYQIKINNKILTENMDEEDQFNDERVRQIRKIQLKDIQKFYSQDQKMNLVKAKNYQQRRPSPLNLGDSSIKTASKFTQSDKELSEKSSSLSQFYSPTASHNSNNFLKEAYFDQSMFGVKSPQVVKNLQLKKKNSVQSQYRHFSTQKMQKIYMLLNFYGSLYTFGLHMLLLTYREEYLKMNYLWQFAFYLLIGAFSNELLHSNFLKYFYYMICFCTFQHSIGSNIPLFSNFLHISFNLVFVLSLIYNQSQNQDSRAIELYDDKKINKIIQSDFQLKNLVQLIPYGVAVLNLEDISHFNYPFGKVLGVSKQQEVVQALQKLKRKIKIDDKIVNHDQSLDSYMLKDQQSDTVSNLKEDLLYILNNRSIAFSNTDYIFDIYYIEKEELLKPRSTFRENSNSSHNIKLSARTRNSNDTSKLHAKKFYSISISPIKWSDKECLLLTIKDVTTEKIVDQKKVLEKLKNMIFKSFTHELKTPLNGIMMSIETSTFLFEKLTKVIEKERKRGLIQLQDCLNQSKQLGTQLKIMESCSFVLKNTMHDFFDYNQLQSNELVLNIKEFNLNECIQDVQRVIANQMRFDKVQFICKIEYQNMQGFLQQEQNQNIKMTSDRDRLQQILLNLLLNAIKFTNKGRIELQVFVKKYSVPQCVKFKVKDTGIGIEPNRLPYIFNLFEKNENSNLQSYLNSNSKSARMGLPISQNLCQLMGGQIKAKSIVGYGTTFSFVLPLKLQHDFIPLNEDFAQEFSEQSQLTRRTIEGSSSKEEQSRMHQSQIEESKDDQSEKMDHYNPNYMDEFLITKTKSNKQDKKKSSKNFYLDSKQKLGGFEMVFKQRDNYPNLFCELTQSNAQEEQDGLSTPRLLHSSTQVENSNKNQEPKHLKILNNLRKMKTSETFLVPVMEQTPFVIDYNNLVDNDQSMTPNLSSHNHYLDLRTNSHRVGSDDKEFKQQNSNFSFQNFMNQFGNQSPQRIDSHKRLHIDPAQLQNQVPISPHHNSSLKVSNQELSEESVSEVSSTYNVFQRTDHSNNDGEETKQENTKVPFQKQAKSKSSFKNLELMKQIQNRKKESIKSFGFDDTFTLNQRRKSSILLKIQTNINQCVGDNNLLIKSENLLTSSQFDDYEIESDRQFLDCRQLERDFHGNPGRELFEPALLCKSQSTKKSSSMSKLVIKNDRKYNTSLMVEELKQDQPQQDQQYYLSNYNDRFSFKVSRYEFSFINNIESKQDVPTLQSMPSLKVEETSNLSRMQQPEVKVENFDKNKKKNKLKIRIKKSSDLVFETNRENQEEDEEEELKVANSAYERPIGMNGLSPFSHANFSNKKAPISFSFWPMQNQKSSNHKHSNQFQASEQSMQNNNDQPFQTRPDQYSSQPSLSRNSPGAQSNSYQFDYSMSYVNQQCHSCPQIMVVDDIQMNRFAVEQMLQLIFGCQALQAENGLDCIERIKEYYYNKNCSCQGVKVILMDIEMPLMDGITATKELKRLMQLGVIPQDIHIIALTAYLDERNNCMQVGMSDFLTKPTSKAQLQELLSKYNIRPDVHD